VNALTEILPAATRRRVYAAYALLGLLLGAAQVAYTSLNLDQPEALTAALAVFAYVGVGIGATAASNTRAAASAPSEPLFLAPQSPEHPDDQDEVGDL
jgi:hypothetical protein